MIKTNASVFLTAETEVKVTTTELGAYISIGDAGGDSTVAIHFLRSDPPSIKNEILTGLQQALDTVVRHQPAPYRERDQAVPNAVELCARDTCHHAKAIHHAYGYTGCDHCSCPWFMPEESYEPAVLPGPQH